jgi:hypothetical protein
VESASVTVKPESTATGVEAVLSPATNEAEPESVVTTGAGSITVTVSVDAVLVAVPSLTAYEIVRLPNLELVLENLTELSAFAHCASVAVAPEEVKVSTPVAAL